MTKKGIVIKRLLVTGATVDEADVKFATGLNVIAYMSQTGKSYILECIDFMLGAKTPPRNIIQSKGYDTVWLEISDMTGQTYTLRRPLTGGGFQMYRLPIAEIKPNSISKKLGATKSAKSSAAKFIMDLCGFPRAELKTNAKNAKGNLSLRTISHFFIVDEISMIDDRTSPVQSRMGFGVTTERSAFKYLLTGQDDSGLETIEPPSIEELGDQVRREVYDELINQLEAELAQLQADGETQSGRLEDLERLLAASSTEMAETSAMIREQQGNRRDAWLKVVEAESRLLVLNELLGRFALLRSHYDSDLQRLDFISEGQHYVDQLETIACPLCGNTLDGHSPDDYPAAGEQLSLEGVQGACGREAEKIRAHVADLEGTVGVLQGEQVEVVDRISSLKESVRAIDQLLVDTLAPRVAAARAQADELIKERSRLINISLLEVRLSTFREVRASFGEAPIEIADEGSDGSVVIDDGALADFCGMMRQLLENWHFLPAKAAVTFDTQRFDFVVAGQARRNNGKGVRAIIHAAFNIALMRYCLEKNLPHPRFVVLDSPLTTYKEPRQHLRIEDLDEVPGEVQTAFFEDLAKADANEQIIVLENKQPPPSIKDKSTYTQFVGYEIPGRAGFFPVAKKLALVTT